MKENKLACETIRHIRDGVTMFLPMNFYGVKGNFVVDTGAAVTLMSVGFYYSIPMEFRPELNKSDPRLKLEVANDGLLSVEGIATFKFILKNTKFEWDMYVTDIREDGLLGLDFLYNNQYMCGTDTGLRLNGKKYETFIHRAPFGVSRVSCVTETIIPANCERVLYGQVDSSLTFLKPCVVGPLLKDNDGLLIGHALVTPGDNIPIPVMNLSDEDIIIHSGQSIASVQEIVDFRPLDPCDNAQFNRQVNNVSSTETWPEGVQKLCDESSVTLTADHILKLKRLLKNHVSVFASSSEDLGFTNVVEHKIDTGTAAPVKQAPRRPPMAFAKDEEIILEKQLKQGLLRNPNPPGPALWFMSESLMVPLVLV
ncbi:uncharacterized protein LOC117337838 [Pecten maximus]|uniref:uncharacterized protein LOC117337838 n=1 Tax=Pecten maximus TaxID=6579 RepID=UPI001458B18C|nr:uncharacterized protein LOC117337838 [Pecten maximus]